jgi:antitoxin MazE
VIALRARISRWGHSLGLRIPRTVAEDLGLADGTPVDLSVVDGDLVVHPLQFTIEDLVAGITPENLHDETAWGRPAAREPW